MLSDLPAFTRRLPTTSAPAPAAGGPRSAAAHRRDDRSCSAVLLEPGNLVAVGDRLGAQLLAVVDGEVTFTARSAAGVQRWRGRLGTRGVVPL